MKNKYTELFNLKRVRKIKSPILTILFIVAFFSAANAQLIVTGNISNAQLIAGLFGPGVTVSNIQVNCGTHQYGTFDATKTKLGIGTGILLTTGDINNATGRFSLDYNGTCINSNNSPTDACIKTGNEYDPCIITFDIVPTCDTMEMHYVFGSTEYPDYVGSPFNDQFGFFINGPKPGGGTYNCYNVALVPGTNTAVAINNVNDGGNGVYYNWPPTNPKYFRDNSQTSDPDHNDIKYGGLTTPLLAIIPVVSCQTYHFKIAIVDISDCNLDSGVFLQSQGMQCAPDQVLVASPSPGNVCPGSPSTLTASGASSYSWSPAASLNTTTGPVVIATPTTTTTYTVTGTIPGGTCTNTQTVVVNVTPGPAISASASSPAICSGGTTTLSASGATTYTWTPSTGLTSTTGSSVTATPGSTITYTVTGTASGCNGTQTVAVAVTPTPTVSVSAVSPSVCPTSSTVINASGATTYTWTPSASLSSSTGSSVTSTPGSTTTYTVTGTTAGCTSGNSTVTVSVYPATKVTVTPPVTICPGGTAPLTAGGATTYTWTPSSGLSATTGASVSATPSVNTIYTVNATDGNGCSGSNTVAVTINASLVVTATAASSFICNGSTSTLITASGATNYTWSPAAGLSNTMYDTATASPSSSTTYTVTGNSGACNATATVSINVNPTPTINIALGGIPSICPGDSIQMTASGAAGFVWTPSTGLNCTTCAITNAGPGSTTTYTVTGTTAGCSAKDSQVISVYPLPVMSVIPKQATVCSGDSVKLTASGVSSYTWSPAAGLNTTIGATVNAAPNANTTYIVTGNGAGGCATTDTVNITVSPKPPVVVTPASSTICSGTNTTISVSGASQYLWSTGSSATTISVNPLVTTTYTVVGIGATGCRDTVSTTINVNPTPTITISVKADSVCGGDTTSAFAVVTGGGSPYTYMWTSGQTTDTAYGLSAGTYTVVVTDVNLCASDSGSFTIGVKTITVGATSSARGNNICQGKSTVLKGTGATSYVWSTGPTILNPGYDTTTVNPTTPTTYTLVGTSGKCMDSTTITINVNPTPTNLTASAAQDTICTGGAGTVLTGSGVGSGGTYVWNPGAISGTPVPVNPSVTTTYTLIGTTSFGCVDSTDVTVNVNVTPTIVISLSGLSDSICKGQSATLLATGGVPGMTYLWSNGGTTSSITVSPGSSTIYSVVAQNGPCASASVSQMVYVYPPLNIAMKDDSTCTGKNTTIGATVTGGKPGYSYVWNGGAGGSSIVVAPVANTMYTCVVTDQCGYRVRDSATVYTFAPSNISFTPEPDTIQGGQFISFVNNTVGALSYIWTFGNGATDTAKTPYEQYLQQGSYIVTLIAINQGCKDTLSHTVYVEENIFIPNVFTPNGDGYNDLFHVTMTGMKDYTIEIFNRWGQKVFTSNSSNTDWDGKSQSGVPESDGVYYYEIKATDYTNKNFSYHGYLQLIRGK